MLTMILEPLRKMRNLNVVYVCVFCLCICQSGFAQNTPSAVTRANESQSTSKETATDTTPNETAATENSPSSVSQPESHDTVTVPKPNTDGESAEDAPALNETPPALNETPPALSETPPVLSETPPVLSETKNVSGTSENVAVEKNALTNDSQLVSDEPTSGTKPNDHGSVESGAPSNIALSHTDLRIKINRRWGVFRSPYTVNINGVEHKFIPQSYTSHVFIIRPWPRSASGPE